MKNIIYVILILFSSSLLLGQDYPQINLDTLCGNYKIEYFGNDNELLEVIFEPATKVVPFLKTEVNLIDNILEYNYSVKNEIQSQQRILFFSCDHHTEIEDITNPNEEWRSGKYTNRSAIEWGHTMSRSDGMRSPNSGIAPNVTVSGFSFKSVGLPTIVNSYFSGATTTLSFPEAPPEEVYKLLRPLRKFPANTVQYKTIGPVETPNPFDPLVFSDTLLYYSNQSYNLNWITDQSIANKYTNHFQNVQNYIEQNNIQESINILNTVLQDVQQDSGVTLSSEAYALIKYNTEYLKEQITPANPNNVE